MEILPSIVLCLKNQSKESSFQELDVSNKGETYLETTINWQCATAASTKLGESS